MCITETHDVHQIANIEKKVPLEWITEDDFVTDDLIHYIRPLIQAELSPLWQTVFQDILTQICDMFRLWCKLFDESGHLLKDTVIANDNTDLIVQEKFLMEYMMHVMSLI